MRGARNKSVKSTDHAGIIPADAGSTEYDKQCGFSDWDHPRGCGEHYILNYQSDDMPGSSPRMRGALMAKDHARHAIGIIPADAESTWPSPGSSRTAWDHPRGCGEHSSRHGASDQGQGSSPRMRGAPLRGHVLRTAGRIIPADAGSTRCHSSLARRSPDHPRGCGEHNPTPTKDTGPAGSSPRMRGALCMALRCGPVGRIIPADAGSTYMQLSTENGYEDHPRGCGEHGILHDRDWYNEGSSPRMRGAPHL